MRNKNNEPLMQLWKWDNCIIAAWNRNQALALLKETFPPEKDIYNGFDFSSLTRLKDCVTIGEPRMVVWSDY